MNGGNTRAIGRQEHCDQCQRDSPRHVWQIIRTVATSGMCHVSIVWRKGHGDDLDGLCTDS